MPAPASAGADVVVKKLPDGYDTLLGETANHLAAGQRQRVALARALFGTPKLVVLDEPNAFLDNEGGLALQKALQDLKQNNVTTIVITHRPNVLSAVDKMLFESMKSS